MDAVVLVGGQGTRLRPLTVDTPKQLLPTGGVPFLVHLLVRARESGIDHVVLSTGFRADEFERLSLPGLDVEYVAEDVPLDTGGGVRHVADRLRADATEPVVVFNGDVLSGHDIGAQVRRHAQTGAAVTLHLVQVGDPRRFGCVPTDDRGQVTGFLEKSPQPTTDQINAGCYVFTRAVIDAIPAGRPVSLERETFPALLADGALLVGFLADAYWLDIGTPESFVQASCDLVTGRAPSSALPGPTGEALLLDGAAVAPDAIVSGGSCVGAGARVESGALVDRSVLLAGAVVSAGAQVRSSVLGRGAHVGARTVVDDVVLATDVRVGADNELCRGLRLWPGVAIPDRSLRFSTDA